MNNEDCATVQTDGQWNDVPCNGYSYASICELGMFLTFFDHIPTLVCNTHHLELLKKVD